MLVPTGIGLWQVPSPPRFVSGCQKCFDETAKITESVHLQKLGVQLFLRVVKQAAAHSAAPGDSYTQLPTEIAGPEKQVMKRCDCCMVICALRASHLLAFPEALPNQVHHLRVRPENCAAQKSRNLEQRVWHKSADPTRPLQQHQHLIASAAPTNVISGKGTESLRNSQRFSAPFAAVWPELRPLSPPHAPSVRCLCNASAAHMAHLQ